MNNSVVFAAAGHGKTYSICERAKSIIANTNKNVLIVTYTNEGVLSIEKEYRKQNLGILDKKIIIKTWYSFILSEIIKPYQCLLKLKYKHNRTEHDFFVPENFVNSIAFYQNGQDTYMYRSNHIQYFINSGGDIRKDKVSHLAHQCIFDSEKKAIERLEKIYDSMFFDELQDYAGWDLEIFRLLFDSSINICCVGDYKQATFRTNNSQKNKRYRDDRIKDYFVALESKNLCKVSYANTTRRFNQEICDFVNMIYTDKNSLIYPYVDDLNSEAENAGVFIVDNKYLETYCEFYLPTILRYDRRSNIKFNHNCNVFNYGNSKGDTFERVVIIPVGTAEPFIKQQKTISSKQTRSKFFVACTRAKYSIVFAMDKPQENDCFKLVNMKFGNNMIPAYKFCKSQSGIGVMPMPRV